MINMDKLTSLDILHYHLLFRNVFKNILRPDKTPVSEFEILMIISENEGLKVGELSDIMSITRPNLTPLVDILEQKELIQRVRDKSDKRITRLYITKKGKAQMNKNIELIEARFSEIKANYKDEDLAKIKELCEAIKNIIK